MQCNYLVPLGRPGIWLKEGDLGECLLPEDHDGDHLVKGENGYYLWQPDEECYFSPECKCESIECYLYSQISDQEAEHLLRGQTQAPAR